MYKGEGRTPDDIDARLAALEKRATTKGSRAGNATVLQGLNLNSPPGAKKGSVKKKKKKKTNLAGKTPPGAGRRSSSGGATAAGRSPVKDVSKLGERRRVATEMQGQADGHPDVLDKSERRRAAEVLAEVRGEGNEPRQGSYSDDWSAHQSAFAKLQSRLDSMTQALDAESSEAGSNSGSGSDGGLLPGTSAVLAGSDGSDSGNSSSFMQEVSNFVCSFHVPSAASLC